MHRSLLAALVLASHALVGAVHAEESPRDSLQDPVLNAVGQYVGDWRAEDAATPDGRQFHFTLHLHWVGPRRQALELVIRQRFDDGEDRLVWQGFKALHPRDGIVKYVAVSTDGRFAEGRVEEEAGGIVTLYKGWPREGVELDIRDVFTPVDGDAFTARTYLRRTDQSEWREVNVDRWERLGTHESG